MCVQINMQWECGCKGFHSVQPCYQPTCLGPTGDHQVVHVKGACPDCIHRNVIEEAGYGGDDPWGADDPFKQDNQTQSGSSSSKSKNKNKSKDKDKEKDHDKGKERERDRHHRDNHDRHRDKGKGRAR